MDDEGEHVSGYSRIVKFHVRFVDGASVCVEAVTPHLAVLAAAREKGRAVAAVVSVGREWRVIGQCSRPQCQAIILDDCKWWFGAAGGLVCEDCP